MYRTASIADHAKQQITHPVAAEAAVLCCELPQPLSHYTPSVVQHGVAGARAIYKRHLQGLSQTLLHVSPRIPRSRILKSSSAGDETNRCCRVVMLPPAASFEQTVKDLKGSVVLLMTKVLSALQDARWPGSTTRSQTINWRSRHLQ